MSRVALACLKQVSVGYFFDISKIKVRKTNREVRAASKDTTGFVLLSTLQIFLVNFDDGWLLFPHEICYPKHGANKAKNHSPHSTALEGKK